MSGVLAGMVSVLYVLGCSYAPPPDVPSRAPTKWSSCCFDIPESDQSICFFVSNGQYRAVQVLRDGKRRSEHWVPVNTGGARVIQVELLGDGLTNPYVVKFSDVLGQFYVFPLAGIIKIPVVVDGRMYLGQMTGLSDGESFQRQGNGAVEVRVGANVATDVTGTYLTSRGRPIGVIEMKEPSPVFRSHDQNGAAASTLDPPTMTP